MRRLNILTWQVHGGYFNALSRVEHNWWVPRKPGNPEGFGGLGTAPDFPPWVREVPAEAVRDLPLDLVLFQSPRNWFEDRYEILSAEQQRLPRIYLEHNTPRPHPTDTRHLVEDPNVLLVHVTHYNRLMWDNGRTPTAVIEHSVGVDPALSYDGQLQRGITVVNSMPRRDRIAGRDIFEQVREMLPLDLAGMENEQLGGLGDIPFPRLHRMLCSYRFLFSPMRYTSLPLAVIEAMTIGVPVVALATTELPTVIENGVNGYVSCDVDTLVEAMRALLADRALAARIGARGRETAQQRFGIQRFASDWNRAFATVLGMP